MEPRSLTQKESLEAAFLELQIRADAEVKNERPTSLGLAWHHDLVVWAPKGDPEEWLESTAATLQNIFQKLGDRSDAERKNSTFRGRHFFKVAKLWFKLFKKFGIAPFVADMWLRKCEVELASSKDQSEEKEELQEDAEELRKKIRKMILGSTVEKLHEPLVSGGVYAIISRVKSLEEGDDWNRKAWNVLVLRAITELLDALSEVSKSTYINDKLTAVYCANQLSELFALIRYKALQTWYSGESKKLTKLVGLPTKQGGGTTNIVAIIEEAIKVSKSVDEILTTLSNVDNLVLSTYNRSYIEIRLIRYNLEQFGKEVDTLMKQSSWKATNTIIKGLDKITEFEHIPAPFVRLKACEILLAYKEHVDKREKQKCIRMFKKACFEHQISLFDPRDIDFVNALQAVLRTCDDVDAVSHALGLRLFYDERANACGKLVSRILEHGTQSPDSDDPMTSLYKVAKDLKDHVDQWSIEDKLKELVWNYIRPVQLQKEVLDGAQVIEVKCKKTMLSKVLPEVLQIFENPRVEEVRFVVPDCFRLDANLDAHVWHGVNVYIQTAVLQVTKQVILDVSGSEGTPKEYHSRAADGTKSGESGENGKDGFAGESGGNVTIFAEEIVHQEWLTVVSRGGDGGKGQDGGDGMHGNDGYTLTYDTLISVLGNDAWLYNHHGPLLEYIKENTETRIEWDEGSNFYHVKTKFGGEIMFSFEFIKWWHTNTFFLHKGSPGMAGGQGGKPGRGGERGYGGLVTIVSKSSQYTQEVVNGQSRGNGQIGKRGASGRSGYDIGFTPHFFSAPTWYGKDTLQLLEVRFTPESPPEEGRWCPHKKEYACIVGSNRSVSYQQSFQVTTESASKLQTQAVANKKKNISTESMLNKYQEYADSVKVTSVVRDNFEEMLERETAELQSLCAVSMKEKVKISVHRKSRIAEQPAKIPGGSIEHFVNRHEHVDTQTAEKYVADIVSNSTVQGKWMNLRYFVPSASQFQRLFKTQDTASSSADIMHFLLDKYRNNSLQQNAKNIEKCFGLFSHNQRGISIEKYIFEIEKSTLTYNPSMQKSVSDHFKKLQHLACQQEDADQTLRRTIKYFADEAKGNEVLKAYVDACTKVEAAKERAWQRYLEVLGKNPEAFDLWVRAYNGERVNDNLRAAIVQDKAVKTALVDFCDAPVYGWNAAAEDNKVLKEVSLFLAASGSLSSACFREVLADSTNQHIRVYQRDEDADDISFKLTAEHGEKHTTKLYVHHTPRGLFQQLQFNRKHFDMDSLRQHKSNVFKCVLEKMNTFKTKEEIDSFVKKLLHPDKVGGRDLENFFLSHLSQAEGCNEQRELNFEADVESVVEHFPANMRSFLSGKLELLHPRYSRNGIVSSLARRLAVEQLQVSSEVFHWLVDLAVEAVANDDATLGLCQFIAAANRQEDWAAELMLIQLDNYLQKEISNKVCLRESLGKVSDQVLLLLSRKLKNDTFLGRIKTMAEDVVQELVSKLAVCGDEVFPKLRNVGVDEWVYVLEETAWRKKLEELAAWKEEQLQESVHFLSMLSRNRNISVASEILKKVAAKSSSELNPAVIRELLFYLQSDDCHLSSLELPEFVATFSFVDLNNTGRKRLTQSEKERDLNDLVTIISNNNNNSDNFIKNLEKIRSAFEDVCSLIISNAKEKVIEFYSKITQTKSSSACGEDSLKKYVKLVGKIDSALRRIMGFRLRATQKLSALLLLANKNNSLIQVATGEGKTVIVLVVAIIKALDGQKVHIVTSSSVLAKRDATSEENVRIYGEFGIKVSHNCSENVEERRSAYSKNQVIYGDLSNFQRDHLLDSFYQKNIMGDHTQKQVMVIDEVDSMLLDKGNNMLYLSHDIGDLDKLDCVFAFIWQRINDPNLVNKKLDLDLIKNPVISALYTLITREDLQLLDRKLSLVQVEELWDRLKKFSIIDTMGNLISEDGWKEECLREACRLPDYEDQHDVLTDRVQFLLKQQRDREKVIEVPNFLKPFVKLHIDAWISNAVQALSMEENQDYVVDVDRSNVSADVFPIVTILDKDTGTDQANSQWDGGLHQFLQMKHGCKLSALSLKAVFISNVTYFKLYENIYGMTGTLGTSKEREMLQRVHDVDFVIMPTFKPKQFTELPPVVCANRCDWTSKIVEETQDMVKTRGRAVLVICETIEEVGMLKEALRKADLVNLHTYTRDYEEFKLPGDKLSPGLVVLATNLAGRGTDIKPEDSLLDAGGLHVVLTYLPQSGRVEQQAFGRAARKGDPGTGRLVVCVPDERGTSTLRVADMRARRDAMSRDTTEEFYKNQILGEEACMAHFTELYKKLEENLSNNKYPKDLKHTLLQFFIDKWAFWLDQNETNIQTDDIKQRIKSLEAALCLHKHFSEIYDQQKVPSLLHFVDQPTTILKIGKYFLDVNANTSIALFDDVVKREPYFSESALYYKCAARVNLMHETDGNDLRMKNEETIREDLLLAARAINRRKISVMQTSRMISSIQKDQVRFTKKDAYQIQAENLMLVLETFEKSIDEMCGAPMSGFELGGGVLELGERVEKDLLDLKILLGLRVRETSKIPKKDLVKLSYDYGISYEKLSDFVVGNKFLNDINQFEANLKEKINLHNSNSFWEILRKNKLIEECAIVAVVKDCCNFETSYPGLQFVSSEDNTEVFLYSNQLPATSERILLSRKSDLVAAVGDEKFKMMLENNEAIELKRAVLAKEVLFGKDFLWADHVTLKDFEATHIAKQDAILVLSELEEQKIFKKRGDMYFMISHNFHDSLKLSLPFYKQTVLNFLDFFFAYDLAYARIKRSVAENPSETEIQIPLMLNPHRFLLMRMFDCGLLERNRVDPNRTDISQKVKTMYLFNLEVAELEKCLKETSRISHQKAEDLYTLLQRKNWLSGKIIQRPSVRLPLVSSQYSDLEPALAKFFETRYKLASMVDSLAKNLEHGRGLLSVLSNPSVSLVRLSDEAKTQAVNIEELTIFEINGFDHLIMLGEKKYTIWMILSASAVIVMGICQIVVGVLMEMYSLGIMNLVGGALIGEGIGDILYGINAFCTGEFSWKDYAKEKALSVAISALTTGFGALIKCVWQSSRFGVQLIGSARGLAISGMVVQRGVSVRRVFTSLSKHVGKKVGTSIAKRVARLGIDEVVHHFEKTLRDKMATVIPKEFDEAFDADEVLQQTLTNALIALGPEGAEVAVMKAVDTVLASKRVVSAWENYSEDVLNKLDSVGYARIYEELEEILVMCVKIDPQVCRCVIVTLANNLKEKNYLLKDDQVNKEHKICKKEVQDKFKNLSVRGITEKFTNGIVKLLILKSLKKAHAGIRTTEPLHFHYNQQQQLEGYNAVTIPCPSDNRQAHTIAVNMRKVLALHKDPVLISKFILANVPLDAVAIQAVASAVSVMSKSNVTITVIGDGTKPTLSYAGQFDTTGMWPHREVQVGVDSVSLFDMDTTGQTAAGGNANLFRKLALLLPDELDASQLQQRLADAMQTDVEVQRAVRRGWHLGATLGFPNIREQRLAQTIVKSSSGVLSSNQNWQLMPQLRIRD